MRRTATLIAAGAAVLMLSCIPALADFEETGFGARTAGMANSFVGLADDVYAVVYNPAALGTQRDREFTASYKKMYWGLSDLSELGENFLAFSFPLKNDRSAGTIGAAIWNFQAANLYRENTLILSYGLSLKEIIKQNIYAGVAVRVLSKEYTSTEYTENSMDFLGSTSYGRDPVFKNGYGKTAIGVDLGAYIPFSRAYSAGVMFKNINRPDTGLADKSILPLITKVGGCYHAARFNVLMDAEFVNKDVNVGPALEKFLLKKKAALRGGFEFGSRDRANLTMGASYRFKGFRLDYAFALPLKGIRGTNGSHGMSLVIFIGEGGTAEEVTEEAPAAYQTAMRQYYLKDYLRAYESFRDLSVSTTLSPKFMRASGDFAAKIQSSMAQMAGKDSSSREVLYAKGFVAYVGRKYPEALVHWQAYLIKNSGNREVRDYYTKVSALFEKEASKAIGGYMLEKITATPEVEHDEE